MDATTPAGPGFAERVAVEEPERLATRGLGRAADWAGGDPESNSNRTSAVRTAAMAYSGVLANPPVFTPRGILALQRAVGNQAVNRLLRRHVEVHKPQAAGAPTPSATIQRQPPDAQPSPQADPAAQVVEQTEWEAHPAIKRHYATWQAYQAVRTRVTAWTEPSVDDVAGYIEAAIGEWTSHGGIHGDFNNNFDGDPHQSYLNLKRLYQKRGIDNPASYFATNIVDITFYNRSTKGHSDLQTALNTAVTAMAAKGQSFTLDKGTWSFVPRTFNDDINKLSNHALGKAIDINPGSNPHVKHHIDVLVIDHICSTILSSGLLATDDIDTLKQASDFFMQTFSDAWVTTQKQLLTSMKSQTPRPPGYADQKSLVAALHSRHKALLGYAAKGFVTLPKDLVEGLQGAGLVWGGEWHTSKDFMHFELQNP